MNRLQHFLVALMMIVCFASTAGHAGSNTPEIKQKEIIPFFGNFKVAQYLFENGLRLLIVEDHSSPTFAYQTWFRVGSKDEVPGKTGLAHLFEHMMFKETKTLKDGEFDKILEGAGAEGENAFTSRDYTAYIQEMPKDKLELIARVEADRMVNLVINDTSFKTEREVVQNERRYRNENSPDGIMDQELFNIAFIKHPYHWPVIGYQEDLNKMSAENAMKFYHAYYSPNRATIVVVGDVDADNVRSVVQKYYGSLKAQAAPVPTLVTEPMQKSIRRKNLKLNIQVEKIFIGFHIPGVTHADVPAIQLLRNVLTGGKSSRLARALVDTGVASGVESYDIEDKDPSLFVVVANLQEHKKASAAEAIILKELAELVKKPVSELELNRAKNKLNFDYFAGLESNYEKAQFLGHYEAAAGTFLEGVHNHEEVQSVSAVAIQKAAKKYLDPNKRTVVTGVKK
jgi:zinc protease